MLFKFLRFFSLVVFFLIGALTCSMYLKSTNEFGRLVVECLGGDRNVHVLIGCLLPLSVALFVKLESAARIIQYTYWFVFLMLFGADEYLQKFSDLRSSNLEDLSMSCLGWLLGASLWWFLFLCFYGNSKIKKDWYIWFSNNSK